MKKQFEGELRMGDPAPIPAPTEIDEWLNWCWMHWCLTSRTYWAQSGKLWQMEGTELSVSTALLAGEVDAYTK